MRNNIPEETGEDIAKIDEYVVSPSTGVHSTLKILPTSSCFGQYTLQLISSQNEIQCAQNISINDTGKHLLPQW